MNKPIHFLTKKFKEYRDDRGWSQKEMAQFLTLKLDRPISAITVNYWENQKRGLQAETALELSQALKVDVMKLTERKYGK